MRGLAYIAVVLLLPGFMHAADLAFAFPSIDAAGQPTEVSDLEERFEQGFSLYQEGEYERSISHFRHIIENEATFSHEEHGLAAYWYGRALEALGRGREAVTLYEATLHLFDEVNVQLADAYVRGVFAHEQTEAYASATEHYLALIGLLGRSMSDSDEELLGEHLAELCLILPTDVMASAGLEACGPDISPVELPSSSGRVLVEWWRGQNLNVSTQANERLEEHLERVAYAREHYTHNGRLEDRGKVYIRLGPPEWRRQVRIDELRDFEESHRLSIAVGTGFELERNEYWIYPSIHDRAHFLFLWDREEGYRLGDASALIPRSLTSGSRNAPLAITVMEYVYRQLSVHANDYVRTYNQVADYKSTLDRVMLFGSSGGPGDLEVPPGSFVQMTMTEARDRDIEIRRLREEDVPSASTNIDEGIEELSGAVRTARFLNEDGSTRTEVYWAVGVDDLEPNRDLRRRLRSENIDQDVPEGYLLLTTLLTQSEDYRERVRQYDRQRLGPFSDADRGGVLAPQTYVVLGDSTDYILSVQWDQYALYRETSEPEPQVGPKLKVQRRRSMPIMALSTDAGTLEMSDLKPLVFTGPEATGQVEENTMVYPYDRILSDTQLALYFEVYNLLFGEDDQTRFTAEFEVVRETRPGFFGRLFGSGTREERTTVEHQFVSDSRRASEFVILDLAEFDADRSNNMEITLRVRDEVSGQQVERSLAFEIVASEE